MNDSSDINKLHLQVIFLKIREKSTEELISIWVENNQNEWSKDDFDAIQKVLLERLGKLPEQKVKHPAILLSLKNRRSVSSESLGVPFFNLSPYDNFRVAFLIFASICLCFGAILSTMVEENTKLFWRFAENSKVSDIEKIELQRIDQNSNGIGELVSISDQESIGEFVSALKTIQEYMPSHPSPENEIRVKIWRTKNRTIEFECYTLEGEGNTIFVGSLWAKPGVYSFGNGHAKFSTPDLYNWLTKNGMKIQE